MTITTTKATTTALSRSRRSAGRPPRPAVAGSAEGRVQRLIQEIKAHQHELELQNEDLRQAQAELIESRDRYQDLYDLAPFGHLSLGQRGEILASNHAAARLLGMPRGQLIGQILLPSVHVGDRVTYVQHLAQAQDTAGLQSCELRLYRRGEGYFWTRLETAGCGGLGETRDVPGAPLHRMFICDVNDRRKTAEVLKSERDNLFRILEAIQDGVFIASIDGELEYVNRTLTRVFGSYEGRQAVEYFGRTAEDEAGFDLDRLLAHGTNRWQWCSKKTHRTYDIVDTLLRKRDGSISKLEIFRDITELKEAEHALATAAIRKDEFLALLAHELRNPLAPLLHAAQLIDSTDEPALVQEARAVIQNQVRHMAHLIDDLLDIARVTSGKITLKKEPLDLTLVADSVRATFEAQVEQAGLSLQFVPHERPLYVKADPVRLAQVITNLLSNAVKFSHPGGRIRLITRLEGRRAQLRVEDSGQGISADQLPHIFEMFHQAGPVGASGRGLGVGLALARNLTALHGGTIEATSSGLDQGAELVIELPLKGPHAEKRPEQPLKALDTAAVPIRVLVVDDNRDSASALGRLLDVMGHEVRIAFDGPSALATCQQFRPAAVILDIGMPGMDGYEVARRLRQLPGCRPLTMVALTGWGQAQTQREARAAGFDHFMIKPADPDELERLLVNSACAGSAKPGASHPR